MVRRKPYSSRKNIYSVFKYGGNRKNIKKGIRFPNKPRHLSNKEWEEYKKNITNITKKGSPDLPAFNKDKITVNEKGGVTPNIVKMNTILANDREIKRLNQVKVKLDSWYDEYNNQSRIALKLQGYNDEEITQYLTLKTQAEEKQKQRLWELIKSDPELRDIFK